MVKNGRIRKKTIQPEISGFIYIHTYIDVRIDRKQNFLNFITYLDLAFFFGHNSQEGAVLIYPKLQGGPKKSL